MGARNRVGIGLSHRHARLHRLAELIPWNQFLSSLKMFKNSGSAHFSNFSTLFLVILLHGRCCKACVTKRSIKLLYLAHFSHVGTLIYCIGRCYFTADLGSLRHHREHGWNGNVAVINNLIFTWFFNKLFLITQPILFTASHKIWKNWYFHLLS